MNAVSAERAWALARAMVDFPKRLLQLLVRAYRLLLSPWLGGSCRFTPTCSAYALEALEVNGAVLGSARAVWRVLRCGPWCEGGHDPVLRFAAVPGEPSPCQTASIVSGRPPSEPSSLKPFFAGPTPAEPVPFPDPHPCGPSSSPATAGPHP